MPLKAFLTGKVTGSPDGATAAELIEARPVAGGGEPVPGDADVGEPPAAGLRDGEQPLGRC